MRPTYAAAAAAAALAVLAVPAIATGDSILSLADTGRQAGDTTAATETTLAPDGDDELEIKGTITSLSPLTVTAGARTAVCSVPDTRSLAGFAIGDFVEMTCDLRAGAFVLRELKLEDADELGRVEDDDDNRGPGNARDDDDRGDRDDSSGLGNGEDDDDHQNRGTGDGADCRDG